MTVINPNSISGITSITLPAGADNVLTIHTNDGTERFRIDSSGNIKVGTAATISPDGDVFFTGVTTATTFTGAHSGSGANLTSLPAAQLSGTLPAISATNLTNIPAANVTGTLPALTAANLTNIPAANLVGVCTAGLTRTGGFGAILQVAATNVTATSSVTVTNASLADTPATVTITSTATNSKFLISGTISGEGNLNPHTVGFVLRRVIGGSGTSINVGDASGSRSSVSFMQNMGYFNQDNASTPSCSVLSPYLDSPSQAAGTAITYKIDIIGTGDSGTFYFGRSVSDSNDASYERLPNNITVMEVAA